MLVIFVIPNENKFGIACLLDYHNNGSVHKAGHNTPFIHRIKVRYFN